MRRLQAFARGKGSLQVDVVALVHIPSVDANQNGLPHVLANSDFPSARVGCEEALRDGALPRRKRAAEVLERLVDGRHKRVVGRLQRERGDEIPVLTNATT